MNNQYLTAFVLLLATLGCAKCFEFCRYHVNDQNVFVSTKGCAFYCCGSCDNRYCCDDKSKRLDQLQCSTCQSYFDDNGFYYLEQTCYPGQSCCGTCTNRYCCSYPDYAINQNLCSNNDTPTVAQETQQTMQVTTPAVQTTSVDNTFNNDSESSDNTTINNIFIIYHNEIIDYYNQTQNPTFIIVRYNSKMIIWFVVGAFAVLLIVASIVSCLKMKKASRSQLPVSISQKNLVDSMSHQNSFNYDIYNNLNTYVPNNLPNSIENHQTKINKQSNVTQDLFQAD